MQTNVMFFFLMLTLEHKSKVMSMQWQWFCRCGISCALLTDFEHIGVMYVVKLLEIYATDTRK